MTNALADCYTQALIGATLQEVEALLGKPFASHHANGMFNQIHHLGDNYASVAFVDGRVVKVDHETERRTVPRVKPIFKRPAFIRFGGIRLLAFIADLSVKSGVFDIESGTQTMPSLVDGDFITVCMSFRTKPATCSFISLAGHIFKTENNRVTVLWDSPFETHSSKILREYISSHLALESLGKTAELALAVNTEVVTDNITVIKSDLCVYCTEGACGLHYNPHKEKIVPTHGGLR